LRERRKVAHTSTMGLCFQIHTCACLGMTYAPCTTTARSFAPTLNYSTPSRRTYRSQVHRKQWTSNFDQGASQLWVEITLKKRTNDVHHLEPGVEHQFGICGQAGHACRSHIPHMSLTSRFCSEKLKVPIVCCGWQVVGATQVLPGKGAAEECFSQM